MDAPVTLYLATLTVRLPIMAEGGLTIGTSTDEPVELDEASHARYVADSMLGYLYEAYERAVEGGTGSGAGRVIGLDAVVDRVERLETVTELGSLRDRIRALNPDYTHVCPVCLLATRGEETCEGGVHLGDPPAHAPVQTQPRETA